MADRQSLGKEGEVIAARFLTEKKYELIEKNYRYGHGEIDLIVKKDNILIFVEVKFRSCSAFGYPEESVRSAKRKKVLDTAEAFIAQINWKSDIRFDIVAITGKEVEHFEDAF